MELRRTRRNREPLENRLAVRYRLEGTRRRSHVLLHRPRDRQRRQHRDGHNEHQLLHRTAHHQREGRRNLHYRGRTVRAQRIRQQRVAGNQLVHLGMLRQGNQEDSRVEGHQVRLLRERFKFLRLPRRQLHDRRQGHILRGHRRRIEHQG